MVIVEETSSDALFGDLKPCWLVAHKLEYNRENNLQNELEDKPHNI